jgi:adenylosuccinate synthase
LIGVLVQLLIDTNIANLELLSKVEVEYVTLPGWKSDISKITTYSELPENCRKYVEFIENYLGVKIGWIGVGPARDSMIVR